MNAPTRRTILGSALAMPVLAGGAALASTTPADPLPAMWAACQRAEAAWLASPDDTSEAEVLWREFRDHEEAIEKTVATTPAGLLAQLDYMAASYGNGLLTSEEPRCVHDVPLAFLDTLKAGLGGLA